MSSIRRFGRFDPPFSPFFSNRIFDDFDFDRSFTRPYWADKNLLEGQRFAEGVGEVSTVLNTVVKFWSYYNTIGTTHVKNFRNFFLKMTPLGVKHAGNPNLTFMKRKNASLIQGRLVY
jgi:hypothetical protein